MIHSGEFTMFTMILAKCQEAPWSLIQTNLIPLPLNRPQLPDFTLTAITADLFFQRGRSIGLYIRAINYNPVRSESLDKKRLIHLNKKTNTRCDEMNLLLNMI